MANDRTNLERRVLLLAPTARDGEATRNILRSVDIECVVFGALEPLCAEMQYGTGAVMVSEETVNADIGECLPRAINGQPVWSDVPIILLTRSGAESPTIERALTTLGNVSLVERPIRISTLVSVIRTALRARERQYEVRDYLSERQKNEQALREARDAAESASRAKDRFLAVLSHELRTPLTPVMMAAALLERSKDLPDAARESVAMIRRNVDLECRLIDDLLDLSRVIAGKMRVKNLPLRIHELLSQTLQYCTSPIYGKRIKVMQEYNASNDNVSGDVARLQQVFWNLLSNATKFTPENGQISLRTYNNDAGRLVVEVQDSGEGIPQDALPKIFDAFEQGDARVTHQFGGLGLGLAIAKAVIDLHGGTISASSEGKGRGSTFTVELQTVAMPEKQPSRLPAAVRDAKKPMTRVLLVEDHPDTADVMSGLLTALGHRVTTADTVKAALDLAQHESFDVVVSDIGLPDASGYELMAAIKQKYLLPGIALSGYGMEEDVQRSRKAGFADHLVKPVDILALEAVIRRVVQHQPAS